MTFEEKRGLISFLMGKNYLISIDLAQSIPDDFNYESFFSRIAPNILPQTEPILLNKDNFSKLMEVPCSKCEIENISTSINIVNNFNDEPVKREISHFVEHFKSRYNSIKNILVHRTELGTAISIKRALEKISNYQRELQNAISTNRNLEKKRLDKVAIIGFVSEKRVTKNGHYILTLEDPTGIVQVLIRNDKDNLKEIGDIVLDEIIGITGSIGDNIIFANHFFFPDVPLGKELKKAPDEVYAAFISDMHVGSKMFLKKEFLNFVSWLNCDMGTDEQKDISRKLKYLFIIGDLVDGVGIYPNQEKDLEIKDIFDQYRECARYLSMIRKDINLIICGGNHDALRMAEPQPQLEKNYAKAIYELPNAILVSNPAYINIHKSAKFPGFDILMYHGYCFDYYIANVDSIRSNGGYDRADLVMSLLLKKRHLSPSHGSTLYIPDAKKDSLVIEKVPDFFISGHIHKNSVSSYRNVTTICGSCWQNKTAFQEKVGHNPEPCRVPVVNLKTRQIRVMRFDSIPNDAS